MGPLSLPNSYYRPLKLLLSLPFTNCKCNKTYKFRHVLTPSNSLDSIKPGLERLHKISSLSKVFTLRPKTWTDGVGPFAAGALAMLQNTRKTTIKTTVTPTGRPYTNIQRTAMIFSGNKTEFEEIFLSNLTVMPYLSDFTAQKGSSTGSPDRAHGQWGLFAKMRAPPKK